MDKEMNQKFTKVSGFQLIILFQTNSFTKNKNVN